MNMQRNTWILLAVGLLLAACGGGGGGMNANDGAGAAPEKTYVLVEPEDGEDIDEIAEDTGARVVGPVAGTPYYRVELPPGMSPGQFAALLDDDFRVMHADLDVDVSVPEGDGSTLPAGGLLLSVELPIQPEILRIGTDLARMRSTGMGVRVAVLDSGIVPHPFVDPNVDPDGWDFVDFDPDPTDEPTGFDDDKDGFVDESYGHGLFVASLIVAVAPDVRIVPIRVLSADGVGAASSLAEAITYAADLGVDAINLSVSMTEEVKVVQDAIRAARQRGVWVIASAGNTGGDDVNFPSSLSDAFAVTAVDAADVVADFASFGSDVDVGAPGVELHGAYPGFEGTARWSGTSFSAALTTGGFALLRQLLPGDASPELLDRLRDTAVDVEDANPGLGGKVGAGRLDLDAATRP